MPTYYELHHWKDVRIVKEIVCEDHLVQIGECGCEV